MVSRSILAVVVVAISFLGAEAGPCRPPSVTSLSENETTSTILAEATSTILAETTSTAVDETTSTVLNEATSTTLAASTTTSQAPSCVETQILKNPGFDDDSDTTSWQGNGRLTTTGAYSAPNARSFQFFNGGGSGSFTQTLSRGLVGSYELSYRYAIPSGESIEAGFSCSIQFRIGNDDYPAISPDQLIGWTESSGYIWNSATDTSGLPFVAFNIECSGEYDSLTLNFDDITLTR
ncbi:hypothetical protein ACLX1H_000517 [Fusarium chlamydosporum]